MMIMRSNNSEHILQNRGCSHNDDSFINILDTTTLLLVYLITSIVPRHVHNNIKDVHQFSDVLHNDYVDIVVIVIFK